MFELSQVHMIQFTYLQVQQYCAWEHQVLTTILNHKTIDDICNCDIPWCARDIRCMCVAKHSPDTDWGTVSCVLSLAALFRASLARADGGKGVEMGGTFVRNRSGRPVRSGIPVRSGPTHHSRSHSLTLLVSVTCFDALSKLVRLPLSSKKFASPPRSLRRRRVRAWIKRRVITLAA